MDEELIKKMQNKKQYHEHIEALEKHLDTHFKSEEMTVFHEMVSLDFHLDVYFITPEDEDFNLLITSGMSLLEMTVPDTIQNKEDYAFAELLIVLPKDVQFEKTFPSEGKNDWIIALIKDMARFPHHQDTFLTEGHSLQAWSDINDTYDENTQFTSCILLPSATFDDDFMEITCDDRIINLYTLFPLYPNELEYKIENGYGKFFDLLIAGNIPDILNNTRKNLLE